MTTLQDQVVEEIGVLLRLYKSQLQRTALGEEWLPGADSYTQETQTRLTAAINRYTLPGDPYRSDSDRLFAENAEPGWRVPRLLGVLTALHDDYRAGHMQSVQETLHADLFSDFLDMAAELQTMGAKDPAAVLTGSVLEEHLRKLAEKSSIPVTNSDGKPRKADALNNDLAKVYGRGEQKQVTAWLDLRNDAAHGHYENYDHAQVALMIDGARQFLLRHLA